MKKIHICLIYDSVSNIDNFEKQIENFDNLNENLKQYFEIFAINKTNKSLDKFKIEIYNDDIINIIDSKWIVILSSDCILQTLSYINLYKKTICTSDLENSIYYLHNNSNNIHYHNSYLIKKTNYRFVNKKNLTSEYLNV